MSSAGLQCAFRCAGCGNIADATHEQITGAEWELCDAPRTDTRRVSEFPAAQERRRAEIWRAERLLRGGRAMTGAAGTAGMRRRIRRQSAAPTPPPLLFAASGSRGVEVRESSARPQPKHPQGVREQAG